MCIIIKSRCFAEVFQHVCIIFYATFRVTFPLQTLYVKLVGRGFRGEEAPRWGET
jgi:hypothetical protein